jgi:catechol 2,3-dioxygenase-like lactoylglutathione lyase family enzyme
VSVPPIAHRLKPGVADLAGNRRRRRWRGDGDRGILADPRSRSRPMQIERLDHLVLTVADIPRTCEFYARVLGMEVVTFGEGRTALKFGQQKINLHPADKIPGLVADRPTPGSGDLCFITAAPLAEVMAHLAQCGVPIVAGPGPRAGAIGTIQSVYIRDPDQNLIEISNY